MNKQRGATLAVTLLILLIITLLGVSSIQMTHMQEKMSANLQDKELSFRAAESALMAGETWLLGLTAEPTVNANCISFPCVQENYQNLDFVTQTPSWWQSHSAIYSTLLDNTISPPRYIVEYLQFAPDTPAIGNSSSDEGVYYYQVTSYGNGSSSDSSSILQTTVARRF